jgi:hypothetical protein
VAYFCTKHTPAECNYDIYYKELIPIIKELDEFGREYKGDAYPLPLTTDHNNLEYFRPKKLWDRRLAESSDYLTFFDFEIVHSPGKSQCKGNALRRRQGEHHESGDERSKCMEQVVLMQQNP